MLEALQESMIVSISAHLDLRCLSHSFVFRLERLGLHGGRALRSAGLLGDVRSQGRQRCKVNLRSPGHAANARQTSTELINWMTKRSPIEEVCGPAAHPISSFCRASPRVFDQLFEWHAQHSAFSSRVG